MPQYVAAIDQGTTSTRCMLFGQGGLPAAAAQQEHKQIYPRPGWVEHDPAEIWQRTQDVVAAALKAAGARPGEIVAVGVANQRETAVVWDCETGRPLHNAVVWQDTRTKELCDRLAEDGGPDRFRDRTGLPLATYFSGPKLQWLLQNVQSVRDAARAGRARFGTVDSWLIWNLTGGPRGGAHVIDVTNASRTMLMNLRTLAWDEHLLSAFDVPPAMLPRIVPSVAADRAGWGTTSPAGPFGAAVPVCGDLGDQ